MKAGRPAWQKAAGVALLVAIAWLFVRGTGKRDDAADAGFAAFSPVAAPEGHLCDLFVPSPNGSWTRLQRAIGGAVGILPATLPGVLLAFADVDAIVADELDGTAPMFGVVAGDPLDPGVVLAIKLVDPRRARALLAGADAGPFVATTDGGTTFLAPRRPNARAFSIALSPNGYLLLARRANDLVRLGPYASQTLPARPLPGDAAATAVVPRRALQVALRPKLEALWNEGRSHLVAEEQRMRTEKGRAPDFGDPAAILATLDAVLGRRIALVGDLERLDVALDVLEDGAALRGTLVPVAGDGPARKWIDGMRLGDTSAALALPAVSTVVVSTRDGEPDRDAQGRDLEAGIVSALGARLKDPAKLKETIALATKARDESFAIAFGLEEPGGAFVRAPVRDAGAAGEAIKGLFDLAKGPPFKELFHVRDVAPGTEDVPGIGKASTLTLTREPKRPEGRPDPKPDPKRAPAGFGVAWIVDQGTLSVGIGAEPAVALRVGAKADRRLQDEPSLKRFIGAVGVQATTVLVAQPIRLDPRRANLPAAPLGIAIGRKDKDGFVRVDAPYGLLREAARWQLGF